jgi:hypothetical protein
MKLLSNDVRVEVLRRLGQEKVSKSVGPLPQSRSIHRDESIVDNAKLNVELMSEDADCTQGVPIETHRAGISGVAVQLAKRVFRKSCQVFINEALARQRRFNGQATDAYAQLSAEVEQLKAQLKRAEGQLAKQSKPKKQKR